MHVNTEQTIVYTRRFMVISEGKDNIGTLQWKLLNTQKSVTVAKYFIFQSKSSRYSYYEIIDVPFL